jgi:3-deoxy-D-manno-octulosonic acid kinase
LSRERPASSGTAPPPQAAGRIAHAGNASYIFDAARYPDFDAGAFERSRWEAEGALLHSTTGRGGVLMLDRNGETWVLRHYHRGGLVSRLVYDHYLWTGLERSRPIREWRLLAHLAGLKLPAPAPVAARVLRQGPIYQADIITRLLPATRPLSSLLHEARLDAALWSRIGRMVAAFHAHGVDHPDLTAHNILVDDRGEIFLVDFDNARLRVPGDWHAARLARLERSLRKVSLETGTHFDTDAWQALVAAYRA